jgi:hypothetical protein
MAGPGGRCESIELSRDYHVNLKGQVILASVNDDGGLGGSQLSKRVQRLDSLD